MSNCLCHANDCLLCEAHLHEGLTEFQACEIKGLLARRELSAHEVLFRQGESSDWLYIVRDGQLKLTIMESDGREQIIRIAVGGQLIGYNSLDEAHHAYTATALTDARLCGIRHRDMLQVLESNVDVSRRMVEMLNAELAQARSLIRILGQKTAAEKLALFLLSLVPTYLPPAQAIAHPMPLSRREIADMLGLTEETVSRLMAELRRERIIEAPRGEVRILDRNALHRFAGLEPDKPAASIFRTR